MLVLLSRASLNHFKKDVFMEHTKVQCQDINNPECLCVACHGFFERGIEVIKDQLLFGNIVSLLKNNSISSKNINRLPIKEQKYGLE